MSYNHNKFNYPVLIENVVKLSTIKEISQTEHQINHPSLGTIATFHGPYSWDLAKQFIVTIELNELVKDMLDNIEEIANLESQIDDLEYEKRDLEDENEENKDKLYKVTEIINDVIDQNDFDLPNMFKHLYKALNEPVEMKEIEKYVERLYAVNRSNSEANQI